MEYIIVPGRTVVDDFGQPVRRSDERRVAVRRIEPATLADTTDESGVWNADSLKIFADPGTDIDDGASVLIRGKKYTIRSTPWDYAAHRRRRPVNPRHRPSVIFFAERGEGVG